MKENKVNDSTIVQLPKVHNLAGNITAIENIGDTIPFDVQRVYYLYDVPGGESRGAHAHKELNQMIIAASGSFDITLDDGNKRRSFNLNRPYLGLYMPSGLWRELDNFSSGAICLVLASHPYNSKDYIRDYRSFKKFKGLS